MSNHNKILILIFAALFGFIIFTSGKKLSYGNEYYKYHVQDNVMAIIPNIVYDNIQEKIIETTIETLIETIVEKIIEMITEIIIEMIIETI